MIRIHLYHILLCAGLFFAGSSCNKLVVADPPGNQLAAAVVFENDATATAAVLGIYSQMMQQVGTNNFPNGLPTFIGGICSDELVYVNTGATYREFNSNTVTPTNAEVRNYWTQAYKFIYQANAIIEGVLQSRSLSPDVQKQLEGESLFIRAFCFFYLSGSFGDTPLTLSTDYHQNASIPRSPITQVRQQIVTDLEKAYQLLSPLYVNGNNGNSTERVRPNKWAAAALLARMYLYTANYDKALAFANEVLQQTSVYGLAPSPELVFEKGSKEALWQLQPVNTVYNFNLQEAFWLIPTGSARPNAVVSPSLLTLLDSTDKRKQQWIKSTVSSGITYLYPYKYRVKGLANTSEWFAVLRLAEVLLIRAEAHVMKGNLADGLNDVNALRTRAGLPRFTSTTSAELLTAIENERRCEFFAEWGHRWYDLKRTGKADGVLSILKGASWQSSDQLLPIPQLDMQSNPSLIQNPGY